jgi:hypothetical protein
VSFFQTWPQWFSAHNRVSPDKVVRTPCGMTNLFFWNLDLEVVGSRL